MIGLFLWILIVALIVGVILWGVAAAPWIDAGIKQLIRVFVIVIFAIFLILQVAGMFGVNVGGPPSRIDYPQHYVR